MKINKATGAAPARPEYPRGSARRRKTVAFAALTLGIVAFLVGWFPVGGAVVGAVAVVVSIVASRRRQEQGKWVTGLVLGCIATVTSIAISAALVNYTPTAGANLAAPPTTPAQEAPAAETVEPESASAAEPAVIREYWPMTADVRIPQFVGMNLADAREKAHRMRLHLREKDDRNERGVWMASNWTVVWQDTAPGSDEREGSYIEVRVLKHDEVGSRVADAFGNDAHHDERMFTGRITGYGREIAMEVRTVMVDAAPVELDLVQPLAPNCGSPLELGYDAPLAELKKQLPIGQRVLVVMSERHHTEGFIHVLSETSNDPTVAPPADSVNERLVRTGWWVPDPMDVKGGVGVTGTGNDAVAYEPYVPRSGTESQAAAYVPHIVTAGNEAVNNYIGTVGDCRRTAEADRDAYVASWHESQREWERLRIESERRANSQQYYCRDGDGDGVCYER